MIKTLFKKCFIVLYLKLESVNSCWVFFSFSYSAVEKVRHLQQKAQSPVDGTSCTGQSPGEAADDPVNAPLTGHRELGTSSSCR